MPTKEQRTIIYKIIIVFAVIMFSAVLQNGRIILPQFFGANALILLPVVCVTGMCLGVNTGFVAGILAGGLWDAVSSTPDGGLALFLGLLGLVSGFLIKEYMRNNMQTALLFSFLSSALLLSIRTLYFAWLFNFKDTSVLFIRFFLPNLTYTFFLSPIIYLVLKRLYFSSIFLPAQGPEVYRLK